VGTTILATSGRIRAVWVTLVPMIFVTITTTTAATEMITRHYWPPGASRFAIGSNIALIILILTCTLAIFVEAAITCWKGARSPHSAA
jgi:carbon starvation protein